VRTFSQTFSEKLLKNPIPLVALCFFRMDFGGANATYLLDMQRLHLLAMRKNQSTTSESGFLNNF